MRNAVLKHSVRFKTTRPKLSNKKEGHGRTTRRYLVYPKLQKSIILNSPAVKQFKIKWVNKKLGLIGGQSRRIDWCTQNRGRRLGNGFDSIQHFKNGRGSNVTVLLYFTIASFLWKFLSRHFQIRAKWKRVTKLSERPSYVENLCWQNCSWRTVFGFNSHVLLHRR